MDVKDGLLAITGEVLGDVQKEAEAIIVAAEREAKETVKAAKEQADKNYQTTINQAKMKADNEQRKIASVTEVEIRNRLLQAKEDLVDSAFQKATIKLKEFVVSEKYQQYLVSLIEEVVKKIDGNSLLVEVNAKDKTWLKKDKLTDLSKKLNCELKLPKQTLDCIGGCKIQTADGKISYDGTIDNRLQELKPSLRVEVAKKLFEKEA